MDFNSINDSAHVPNLPVDAVSRGKPARRVNPNRPALPAPRAMRKGLLSGVPGSPRCPPLRARL